MNKKLARQRRAFDRLCENLPANLVAWSFSQRQEYFKLSKVFGQSKKVDDLTDRFARGFTPDTVVTHNGKGYQV